MKYFTIEELCQSETADKHKIGNHPTADVRAALVDLINNVLDPAREALGMPIAAHAGRSRGYYLLRQRPAVRFHS